MEEMINFIVNEYIFAARIYDPVVQDLRFDSLNQKITFVKIKW